MKYQKHSVVIALCAIAILALSSHKLPTTTPSYIGASVLDSDSTLVGHYTYGTDGISQQTSIANATAPQITGPLTVSLWFKYASSSSGVTASLLNKQGSYSLAIYGYNGNTAYFEIRGAGVYERHQVTVPRYLDGKWHQLAGVYDGSNLKVYFDGKHIGTKATTRTSIDVSNADIIFKQGNQLPGSINNVRIYKKALSDSEIQTLYTSEGGVLVSQPASVPPVAASTTSTTSISQPPQNPPQTQPPVQTQPPATTPLPEPEPEPEPAPSIPYSGPAQVIGAEALQKLPGAALWNIGVNFRPGDGEVTTTNPPQFSWLYAPDPTLLNNSQTDIQPKLFIFQTSYDSDFKTYINNIQTPLNFYNTIKPFNAGATVYWRIGYVKKEGGEPYAWSKTRKFTASGPLWDRSDIADTGYGPLPAYLAERAAHPHMLFTAQTAPALSQFLETSGGSSWTAIKNSAKNAIKQPTWGNKPTAVSGTSNTAVNIGNVALTLWMASSSPTAANQALAAELRAAKPGTALANLAEFYMEQNGHVKDVITVSNFKEVIRVLGFGYDWLYHEMTPGEREIVLNALNARAACILYGWWFYESAVAPYTWGQCDPNGQPNTLESKSHVRSGSGFKRGSSHGIDNFITAMTGAMAAYGDGKQELRLLMNYGLNYLVGVVFPYGFDGTSMEGRPYSGGSLFWFDNGNVLYHSMLAQMVFPKANMQLNPYWHAAVKWWDAIEPVNFTQGHEAWGDTGMGSANAWGNLFMGRDLSHFTQNPEAYQHFLKQKGIVAAGGHGDNLNNQPYYSVVVPFHFPAPAQRNSSQLHHVFPESGWALGCSKPQNTPECFNNGVGYIFSARPMGDNGGHAHLTNLSYQLWAYGNPVTDQGAQYPGTYGIVPMAQQSLLINGWGVCQNTEKVLYPYHARIFAHKISQDYVYMAADGTNSYPTKNFSCTIPGTDNSVFGKVYDAAKNDGLLTKVGLQKVRRHILFVKDKYFVVYDEFQTKVPATFTSLYHVLEGLNTDFQNGRFSYTTNINNLFRKTNNANWILNRNAVSPTVTVKVQYMNDPSSIEILNNVPSGKIFTNPLIAAESYTHNVENLPRQSTIWTSNKDKKTSFHVMTAIYPENPNIAQPAQLTRLDDHTVKVVNQDGSTDIISFNPSTAAANGATILVDLSKLTPLPVQDNITGVTHESIKYEPPKADSPDMDGDGVLNTADLCPNTAISQKGLVNSHGCAKPRLTTFDIFPNLDVDLRSLTGVEIGKSLFGKIKFDQSVSLTRDTTQLDVDSGVKIEKNKVTVDSRIVPELDKPATVTLYSVTEKNPKILKDGKVCTQCQIISHINGTLIFTVPGF